MTEREFYQAVLESFRRHARSPTVARAYRAHGLEIMTLVVGDGGFMLRSGRPCPFCGCRAVTSYLASPPLPCPQVDRRDDEVAYWREEVRFEERQLDDVLECFLCAATTTRRDVIGAEPQGESYARRMLKQALAATPATRRKAGR